MKYKTIIETDDFENFEFFEDGNGKYIHGIDAGAENNEWIALYFTECEQESSRDIKEIEEIINCDADAETKCKMISNILTSKPHYFKEPQQEMTRDEAIDILEEVKELDDSIYQYNIKYLKAFEMAIQALEQEPCEDAISREDAIKQCGFGMTSLLIADNLRKLPPVKPQERTGHWEWIQYDSNPNIGNWHCSECRTIISHMPEETDNTPIYKWCPMCGARMEVENG